MNPEEKAYWEWRDTQGIMTKDALHFAADAHLHGFDAGLKHAYREQREHAARKLQALEEGKE